MLAISTIALLFILSGCRQSNSNIYIYRERGRYAEIDSMLRPIRNTDSLRAIYDQYKVLDDKMGQMLVLKQLGKCQREQNQFTEAIESHRQSYNIAVELCDTQEIVYALNSIGTNYRRMSMLDEATQNHYRALAYCDTFSDSLSFVSRKNRVISLNGIGNIALSLGDYETADSVFRQALKGEKQLGSALGQAINYANLGAIYEHYGLLDSAWAYYRLSMQKNIEADSHLGISLCHGYFGGLHEKQGDLDKAVQEYEQAYAMKGRIDSWHWLNALLSLAKLHVSRGNADEALVLLSHGEQEALAGKSNGHLADIYKLYYRIWQLRGDAPKALSAYMKSHAYSDSILNEKNLIEVQNERVRYEYERRQHEIDHLNDTFRKDRKYRNTLIVGMCVIVLLLIAVMSFLLYVLRLRKQRQREVQRVDRMRSTFFTNITHEFRTPLTVIIGLAERMQLPTSADNLSAIGSAIMRQGRSMLELINQILDMAKATSATVESDYEHGDVVGFIHTLVESTRELTRKKQIELLFVPSETRVLMDFVPDYLAKIVRNLISNAVKFAPEYGRVFLTSTVEGENLKLWVADNGCGISAEDLPHIFEPFWQSESNGITIGSGIGLSLVQQLVAAMGGSIEVKSAPGAGTVFLLSFPMRHGTAQHKELSALPAPEPLPVQDAEEVTQFAEIDSEESLVILLVEDNNDVASYVSSILTETKVHFARNGKEGLEKAYSVVPDIIITDIMMPVMDGIELCKEIRKSDILNHIPIVVLSAKSTERDKLECLRAGADSYIYKPFSAAELLVTVNTLLERRKALQHSFANVASASQPDKEASSMSSQDQEFLSKVVNMVYAQMAHQNVNVNDLASSLCMSPKQLNRKISAITGENASRYVLRVRMTKAKTLLDSNRNYTIAEVAQLCGFEENSNFTRAFKSFFEITPSQYRKRP